MSRVSHLGFVEPQLPTLTDQPPAGDGWIHEIKHDGYRTLLLRDRCSVRAFTRNGHDWSDRYPGIVDSAAGLECRSAILDGEVIVQDVRGASDFAGLQHALKHRPHSLIFYAFDLLHLDGKDLRALPLIERRAKLKELIGGDGAGALQFSEEFIGDGAALFRACAKHRLEGIVSKLVSSRYRSGRSRSWLKTKCFVESELTLIGIDRDRKTGAARALLARPDRSNLIYAGAAFLALNEAARKELKAKVAPLAQEQPAFPWLRNRKAQWVKPKLNMRVKHLASGGLLRHATVKAVC